VVGPLATDLEGPAARVWSTLFLDAGDSAERRDAPLSPDFFSCFESALDCFPAAPEEVAVSSSFFFWKDQTSTLTHWKFEGDNKDGDWKVVEADVVALSSSGSKVRAHSGPPREIPSFDAFTKLEFS